MQSKCSTKSQVNQNGQELLLHVNACEGESPYNESIHEGGVKLLLGHLYHKGEKLEEFHITNVARNRTPGDGFLGGI